MAADDANFSSTRRRLAEASALICDQTVALTTKRSNCQQISRSRSATYDGGAVEDGHFRRRARAIHVAAKPSDFFNTLPTWAMEIPMARSLRRSLFIIATLARAQTSLAQSDPLDVGRSAFAALDRHNWTTIVGATHPEWLRKFRSEQLALLVTWAQSREPMRRGKASGMKAFDMSVSSLGDSAQAAALAEVRTVRVRVFPGSPTIGALAALTPDLFFARWLAAISAQPDSIIPLFGIGPRHLIGAVVEGDSLAHVLYRHDTDEYDDPWRVEVLALKRSAGRWLLLPNNDFASKIALGHVLFR